MHRPPPVVPADPVIEIAGAAVDAPLTVPLTELARLPRREQTSDFHCVAGWSATGLRWEGVPYERFHRLVVEPALRPGANVTHVVFAGLDGYRFAVTLEDALADDVLIAEHLDGRPLDSDHGAPVRLVSPSQYGYVNVKHLSRIEPHSSAPAGHSAPLRWVEAGLRVAVTPHRRARVWREERHRFIPGRLLRVPYRALIAPIRALSGRGSR